jgi:signal transduction histidine kinase
MLGKTLPALVAAAALGLLVFLVYQSRPVSIAEHAGQARTVDLIRQSAEDVRTLGQVLAADRRELRRPGIAIQSITDRLREQRAAVEQSVIARGGTIPSELISAGLQDYSATLAAVNLHTEQFTLAQTEFSEAVAALRESSGAVIQRLRTRGDEQVAQRLFSLVSRTLDYARSDRGTTTASLTEQLEAVRADGALQASQSTAVSDLLGQTATVLANRDTADSAIQGLLAEPFLESASRLAGANEAAYRARLDRVERSRLLLVAYCALLLLGVGFVMYRLNLSYRRINDANEALAGANEGLEARVMDRTAELENAYDTLKESQVQLVQAEKMSSLGQLVAGISHEINTPLLYLQSNASLVSERLDLLDSFVRRAEAVLCMQPREGEAARDFSQRFLKALKQLKRVLLREELGEVVAEAGELMKDSDDGLRDLTGMAQSLKDFSRLDRAPMDQFDVNEGLEKTLRIAAHAIKQKADVSREFGELPSIYCCGS